MFTGLKDKVIIVTGSGGLIGAEVVSCLIEHGSKVIGLDVHNENENTDFYNCDITNYDQLDEVLDKIGSKYGRIDGLVNLAYPRTKDWGVKFEAEPLSSWQTNVEIQLNSVFYICQKVLKVMKEQKSGSIVNTGSIYGVVGNDFTIYEDFGGTSPAAYSAIKGGVINFSKYLASYYGKYNIRVNCISPGGVLDESKQHPSFIKKYSDKSPMKRLANPEEMAPPVAFLLSESASYITGHNLMVDGGWTAI
ncbi:SDR family oxidoreductase [Pontibacter locisalis]|uniref:SDR family oxidoreductase n=1 Tax=Pontibacter locisalis TaxID=1719035 RepID=A0ABW5IMM5_9BACT